MNYQKIVASLLLVLVSGCGSPTYKRDASQGVIDPNTSSKTYESSAGKGTPATGTDASIATGVALVQSAMQSGKKKNSENKIQGQCVIVAQGTELPCPSVMLVLKKTDASIVRQDRTRLDGSFSFDVKSDVTYQIEPQNSKFILEKSSQNSFKAGTNLKLRLQSR